MKDNSRRLARTWPYPRHRYFEHYLQTAAASWFAARSLRVRSKMPYILAEWEDWHSNVILPEVAEYVKTERRKRKGFPLHKYIHHGLSSQAMLFNLVGPLIVKDDLEPLRSAFEQRYPVISFLSDTPMNTTPPLVFANADNVL